MILYRYYRNTYNKKCFVRHHALLGIILGHMIKVNVTRWSTFISSDMLRLIQGIYIPNVNSVSCTQQEFQTIVNFADRDRDKQTDGRTNSENNIPPIVISGAHNKNNKTSDH